MHHWLSTPYFIVQNAHYMLEDPNAINDLRL